MEKVKRRLWCALICSIIALISLVSIFYLVTPETNEPSYFGKKYSQIIAVGLIYVGWIYFLHVYVYLLWAERSNDKKRQFIKAIIIAFIGLFLREMIQIRDSSYKAPGVEQYIVYFITGVILYFSARILYLRKLDK